MSREDRHRLMLEVAAQIVEAEGWSALTMSALADRGSISRQLVYMHFPNLKNLLSEVAWHIFNEMIVKIRDSIAMNPDNPAEAVKAAEAASLDLSDGLGDALWHLIAGTAGSSAELDSVRRGLREVIIETWRPVVARGLGEDAVESRIISWALVMGFWGMRQLVRDGQINRDQGLSAFSRLLDRLEMKPA